MAPDTTPNQQQSLWSIGYLKLLGFTKAMIPLSISGPFFPLCWYDARSPYDREKTGKKIFKIKHSSSNCVIHFANLPHGVSAMWRIQGRQKTGIEQNIPIGNYSSNTQFGKYVYSQCIKSAEQLFTFVVLVFSQLSALEWLSKAMAKGAEDRVWPEAGGDNKADGLGVLQSPSLHFLLLSPATGLSGAQMGSGAM